jgi:hypothetical protein
MFFPPDVKPPQMCSSCDCIASDGCIRRPDRRLHAGEAAELPGVACGYPGSSELATTGYIRQPDGDTCGPTSVRNALVNWGKNISVAAMKPQVGFDVDQTPWSDQYDRPSAQWGNPYGRQSTTIQTLTTLLSTHGMVW